MSNIYVPYSSSHVKDEQDINKYLLYLIEMNIGHYNWSIPLAEKYDNENDKEIINNRFKGLQEYFINHYLKNYLFDFHLSTYLSNGDHENITILTKDTTSIFLGIFLKAAKDIMELKFREDWEMVCATGDLKYSKNETLLLTAVEDIDKKFEHKFKKLADENKEKKYLFVYINDKEIKATGEGIGKNGNITVKRFSPNDTIDDILFYLFEGLSLPIPIKCKVDLNLTNIAKLRKYIANFYLYNVENNNISPEDRIAGNFFGYKDVDYYKGFISACLCMLSLIESNFRTDNDLPDNHVFTLALIKIMGSIRLVSEKALEKSSIKSIFLNLRKFFQKLKFLISFNKILKQTSPDGKISTSYDIDSYFDHHWNMESFYKDFTGEIQGKVSSFCPQMQTKLFYRGWNHFCILSLGKISLIEDESERDVLYSSKKMKYKIIDSIDYHLEEYLKEHHNELYTLWGRIDCLLICEFKLDEYGYREIEEYMDHNNIKIIDELPWKEYYKIFLDFNENDKKYIENIFNLFKKDQPKGLKIAANMLFAEKNL